MSHRYTVAGLLTALAIGLICYLSPGALMGQGAKAPDATTWAVPAVAWATPAGMTAAAPSTPEQWADKVIGISFQGHGVAMEKAQLRQIGHRTFLVGKVLDEGIPSPTSGRVSWIPTESVEYLVEFANETQYYKAAAAARAWGVPAAIAPPAPSYAVPAAVPTTPTYPVPAVAPPAPAAPAPVPATPS